MNFLCFMCRYGGSHLLDAIDSFQPPSRDFSKPLLMPICDVIKSPSLGQVSACGKLEAGALRSGFKVIVSIKKNNNNKVQLVISQRKIH